MAKKETYASAGVNVGQAELFVERLKGRSRRSGHQNLWKAAGGYACIYPVSEDVGMAFTTDGVGTKLLLAIEESRFETIGIDLAAMCANDLICVGARPALFLDYFAVGKLDDNQSDAIIEGIVQGCDLAGMILAGGETAEMPGLYADRHFDLAGFAAGQVSRQSLLTGEAIGAGQKVIGVASSGIHANGLSLARRILAKLTDSSAQEMRHGLLEPTAIYVKPVLETLQTYANSISGIAHITGGGWRNTLRLNPKVGLEITAPLPVSPIFQSIGSHVEEEEMYKTFNMGMGLVVIASSSEEEICEVFRKHGFDSKVVGEVTDEAGVVRITGFDFTLKDKTA